MAPEILTSPALRIPSPQILTADPQTLGVKELRERMQFAQEEQSLVLQRLEKEMEQLHILFEHAKINEDADSRAKRAEQPEIYDDLLVHPSYQNDQTFVPDGLDQLRRDAYLLREQNILELTGKLQQMQNRAQYFADLHRHATTVLSQWDSERSALENRLPAIDQKKGIWKFWSGLTGERENVIAQRDVLATKRDALQASADKHVLQRNEVLPEIDRLQVEIDRSGNTPYDQALLHGEEARSERILPRTQQSVLFSYDGYKTVTLRLPVSATDTDFTSTLKFRFEDEDLMNEFVQLIGTDIPVEAAPFFSVGGNVETRYKMENELIPLSLEEVNVKGKKLLRLPRLVWEKFVG